MTDVYRIELLVIDDDNLGTDEVRDVIEDTRYPNHCIAPDVMSIEVRKVEWSDEHPLNRRATQRAEFERLFRKPPVLDADDIAAIQRARRLARGEVLGSGTAAKAAQQTVDALDKILRAHGIATSESGNQ